MPKCLFKLHSLHTLIADHNQMKQLPKGMLDMTSLTSLNLSNNPIETIPGEVSLMTNLIHIYTSKGGRIPGTGQHLPSGWTRLHTVRIHAAICSTEWQHRLH